MKIFNLHIFILLLFVSCKGGGGGASAPVIDIPSVPVDIKNELDELANNTGGNTISQSKFQLSINAQNIVYGDVLINLNSGLEFLSFSMQESKSFAHEFQKDDNFELSISSQNGPVSCSLSTLSGTFNSSDITVDLICPLPSVIRLNSNKDSSFVGDTISVGIEGEISGIWYDFSSYAPISLDSQTIALFESGVLSLLAEGNLQLNAEFNGLVDIKTINIRAPQTLSIESGLSEFDIQVGQSITVDFFANYEDGQRVLITSGLTSTISDLAILSGQGTYTGESEGKATITATFEGVSTSIQANVVAELPTHLEISPFMMNANISEEVDFKVMAIFKDGRSEDYTAQSNLSISDSTLGTLSGKHLAFIQGGDLIVSAQYKNITQTLPIKINSSQVSSLSIQTSSSSLPVGFDMDVKVIAEYEDGTQQDITALVEINVSDNSLATLENSKLTSLGEGTITLSASFNTQSSQKDLQMTNESLQNLSISPSSAFLGKDLSKKFTAFATFDGGSVIDISQKVNWSVEDSTLATIDNLGNVQNINNDTSFVKKEVYAIYSGFNAISSIMISNSMLTQIVVTPNSGTLAVGDQLQMKAYGVFEDGGTYEMTDNVSWSSLQPAIGLIETQGIYNGRLNALSSGVVDVEAVLNGFKDSVKLNVEDGGISQLAEAGLGLSAEFFSGTNYLDPSSSVGSRIDAEIDFNWDKGDAPLGVGDYFSVRWSGQILSPVSEDITFHVRSDDGLRLFIDGNLIIDQWNTHSPRWDKGVVTLEAGKKYDVTIEYFEASGRAIIDFEWESISITRQNVPQSNLFPF
ncbi:MAG: Ig-like domain-containing protein [Halobacteriovoraceae bacterium]|nr:Ig-like domain-containing protein [Halobacteriovoraceae bacterium]